MLYWMCKDTGLSLLSSQLENAIRRNFDGFSKIDTWGCFMKHLHLDDQTEGSREVGPELQLVRENLKANERPWHE